VALGHRVHPVVGAGLHKTEHAHRHQTAVFRSGETCPEAGSKRALPSNNPGALPPENGFPLNNVREYEVKLTHTRNTSVTVYPCGPRTKAVALGAWLHLNPWKRRLGPGGNHGEHTEV
jgi:hypothetical protein